MLNARTRAGLSAVVGELEQLVAARELNLAHLRELAAYRTSHGLADGTGAALAARVEHRLAETLARRAELLARLG